MKLGAFAAHDEGEKSQVKHRIEDTSIAFRKLVADEAINGYCATNYGYTELNPSGKPAETLYGFYFSQPNKSGKKSPGAGGEAGDGFFYQPKSIYGTDLETRFLDMMTRS